MTPLKKRLIEDMKSKKFSHQQLSEYRIRFHRLRTGNLEKSRRWHKSVLLQCAHLPAIPVIEIANRVNG